MDPTLKGLFETSPGLMNQLTRGPDHATPPSASAAAAASNQLNKAINQNKSKQTNAAQLANTHKGGCVMMMMMCEAHQGCGSLTALWLDLDLRFTHF